MKKVVSSLSGNEILPSEVIYAKHIGKPIFDLIVKDNAGFSRDSVISLTELNFFREKYIAGFLMKDIAEITQLENEVIQSLRDSSFLSKLEVDTQHYTLGQRVADKVAEFGGSWTFIISFFCFLFFWILINTVWFVFKVFDPYPFILLNLILSCLASIQAPIIMMSQNRQEEKDRDRSKNDYMVNLKSELEIRLLHEKLDHLIMHQEQALIEIQKEQIRMMGDILKQIKKDK